MAEWYGQKKQVQEEFPNKELRKKYHVAFANGIRGIERITRHRLQPKEKNEQTKNFSIEGQILIQLAAEF